MSKSSRNISVKTGMPPGSLVHVGDELAMETKISVIDYNKENMEEVGISSVNDISPFQNKTTVTWVNVVGLKDVDLIDAIGQQFGIHPLILEDILNTHQRPKMEEHDDYLFIVLKNLSQEKDKYAVTYEQISIVMFNNLVFTFREKSNDLFEPLIQRIKNSRGRIRGQGSDYLTYTIIDTIVDQCFVLLEAFEDIIEALEEEILNNAAKDTLSIIQSLKHELINVRKFVSPLRELLTMLLRSENSLIQEKTHVYFKDVYDHAIHIAEEIESHRDMLTGLLDIYISSVSNKMNEVMKILTVFASIFIPLTFIAGIYGMNFEYMPELKVWWAYPVLWACFIIIPVVLLIYFRRKHWL